MTSLSSLQAAVGASHAHQAVIGDAAITGATVEYAFVGYMFAEVVLVPAVFAFEEDPPEYVVSIEPAKSD